MIERLILPNVSVSLQRPVCEVRRRSLDCIHDLGQRPHPLPFLVYERSENQVHVVGHDHGYIQINFRAVVMGTAAKHDQARFRRQGPALAGGECDEMPFVVALQVRKIAPVKCHTHVGAAEGGCPLSRQNTTKRGSRGRLPRELPEYSQRGQPRAAAP